jgi:hypothetical protein
VSGNQRKGYISRDLGHMQSKGVLSGTEDPTESGSSMFEVCANWCISVVCSLGLNTQCLRMEKTNG